MAHSDQDWNTFPLLSNNVDDEEIAYNMDYYNLNYLKELSKLPPPLGLKLTLTPEMLPLPFTKQQKITTTCQTAHQVNKAEKLKAVHLPMYVLIIGFFKVEAKYPTDLVAKFYYAKRKLVWEILHDGLKVKIEVRWQNISAIQAVIEDNLPGFLEIELDTVPSFFREIEPKPGKHTVWAMSRDFTDGQASKYRRHCLQFPPGVLDRYYAKLLQCDNRLLELSQKPFPSSYATTYFDSHLDHMTTQLVFGHDNLENSFDTEQHFTPLPLIASYINQTSDETINNQMLQDPMLTTSWNEGFYSDTLLSMGSELNYELVLPPSHTNNVLLTDYIYSIPEIEFNKRYI